MKNPGLKKTPKAFLTVTTRSRMTSTILILLIKRTRTTSITQRLMKIEGSEQNPHLKSLNRLVGGLQLPLRARSGARNHGQDRQGSNHQPW
ncbi:hypothetical protein D3C84_965840 [compost metagenome]